MSVLLAKNEHAIGLRFWKQEKEILQQARTMDYRHAAYQNRFEFDLKIRDPTIDQKLFKPIGSCTSFAVACREHICHDLAVACSTDM